MIIFYVKSKKKTTKFSGDVKASTIEPLFKKKDTDAVDYEVSIIYDENVYAEIEMTVDRDKTMTG